MAAAGRQVIDWAALRDYEEHLLIRPRDFDNMTSVALQHRAHNQARYRGERVITSTIGMNAIRLQFFPAPSEDGEGA